MKKIEKLAKEARESLSDFCINECKAYCCRKGYLIVQDEELNLITKNIREKLLEEGSVKEMWNGKFTLNFGNSIGRCPALDSKFRCKIHGNDKRPLTCKDFPIFILGKKIKISPRCPAKKENKFFKFEKEAKNLGYEIVNDLF